VEGASGVEGANEVEGASGASGVSVEAKQVGETRLGSSTEGDHTLQSVDPGGSHTRRAYPHLELVLGFKRKSPGLSYLHGTLVR
jgi:hypothetical protein